MSSVEDLRTDFRKIVKKTPNSRNMLNLRLTRRSGSAGVAGSSFSIIALFGLAFL